MVYTVCSPTRETFLRMKLQSNCNWKGKQDLMQREENDTGEKSSRPNVSVSKGPSNREKEIGEVRPVIARFL